MFQARHDELRRAARDFIGASREAPAEVCATLDGAVRAVWPSADAILFLERDAGELACIYATGARAEYFRGSRLSLERDSSALTIAALESRRVSHRTAAPPAIPGDRTFFGVPMSDGGDIIGVFYCSSTSTRVDMPEDDIVTLVDLATPAYRVAIDRAADRRKATIDALTGLLTPRAFRAQLSDLAALAAAQADGRLTLLYVDTDNFKKCNDSLGHAAGDVVLRTISRLLAANAGSESLIGRNGGDEFCVLYSGVTKTDAVRRAERIRQAIDAYDFNQLLGVELPHRITASIGVAALPSEADTWEGLLEKADQAMYHSKSRGRNRVSFYGLAGNIVDLSEEGAPVSRQGALASALRLDPR